MTTHQIIARGARTARPGRRSAVTVQCSCGTTSSGRSGVEAALRAHDKHVQRARAKEEKADGTQ